MKQLLTVLLLVGLGTAASAQKILKEKTVTRADGSVVERKSKLEYERTPSASANIRVGSSSRAHSAYRSMRHDNTARHNTRYHRTNAHSATAYRRHHAGHMTSESGHAAFRPATTARVVHYKKYKSVVKHGKRKIKFKK